MGESYLPGHLSSCVVAVPFSSEGCGRIHIYRPYDNYPGFHHRTDISASSGRVGGRGGGGGGLGGGLGGGGGGRGGAGVAGLDGLAVVSYVGNFAHVVHEWEFC